MVIISGIDIEGVELAVYEHNQYDKDGNVTATRSFETWQVAGYSILFVISFYFMVSTFRIFVRKIRKVENKGQTGSLFDRLQKYVSQLTLYMIFSWLGCILWGSLGWWVTGYFEWISFGIFGTAAILNFARAFIYFTLNGY